MRSMHFTYVNESLDWMLRRCFTDSASTRLSRSRKRKTNSKFATSELLFTMLEV